MNSGQINKGNKVTIVHTLVYSSKDILRPIGRKENQSEVAFVFYHDH